jgi:hypothetical protein
MGFLDALEINTTVRIAPDGWMHMRAAQSGGGSVMRWSCAVRVDIATGPSAPPAPFVLMGSELRRWWSLTRSTSNDSTRLRLVYPASRGRDDVGFEVVGVDGKVEGGTLVGVTRPSSGVDNDGGDDERNEAPCADLIDAPASTLGSLAYLQLRARGVCYLTARAKVVPGPVAEEGAAVALWPSDWVFGSDPTGRANAGDIMVFPDRSGRPRAPDDGDAGRGARAKGLARRIARLPPEMRALVVWWTVRACMPVRPPCLADLVAWMSLHAPLAQRCGVFREAGRATFAERARAYAAAAIVGPPLPVCGNCLRTVDRSVSALGPQFRAAKWGHHAPKNSKRVARVRLMFWRPGTRPMMRFDIDAPDRTTGATALRMSVVLS